MLNIPRIFAQSPALVWVKSIGGTSSDYAYQILTDSKGNVYTLGDYTGSVDFDPSKAGSFFLTSSKNYSSSFLQKMDSNGNFKWAKEIVDISSSGMVIDNGPLMTIDADDNIYVLGYNTGATIVPIGKDTVTIDTAGIVVAKINCDGNYIWVKSISSNGAGDFFFSSIVADKHDGIYVNVNFRKTIDFDPGPGKFHLSSNGDIDAFVLKLDTSGKFKWAGKIGGLNSDNTGAMALDSSGNLYISGSYSDSADFDPGPGTFLMRAYWGMFITKLDSNGNFKWADQNIGATYGEIATMKIDSRNNLIVAGIYAGTCDFNPGAAFDALKSIGGGLGNTASANIFIQKLDSGGHFIWVKSVAGISFSPYVAALAIDAKDNIYTTGRFGGKSDFDPGASTFYLYSNSATDIYVEKLDSAGNFKWAFNEGGGAGTNEGNSIAIDANSNIYLTGIFLGTTNFEPWSVDNITSNGSFDIFIQKIVESPTISGVEGNALDKKMWRIYPNPGNGDFVVGLDKVYANASIEIRDITGRLVYTEKSEYKSTLAISLDAPAGMYIATIITRDIAQTMKIMKE